jgi:hypothetical protein
MGFEPTFSAGERPQTNALDRAAIGIVHVNCTEVNDYDNITLSCRRMAKIIWTDRVRNEEVLHTVKEDRNIVDSKQGRLAGLVTLRRNCLLKHFFIKGKTEGRICDGKTKNKTYAATGALRKR